MPYSSKREIVSIYLAGLRPVRRYGVDDITGYSNEPLIGPDEKLVKRFVEAAPLDLLKGIADA